MKTSFVRRCHAWRTKSGSLRPHVHELLAGELSDFERDEVSKIEEFGCFVLTVQGNVGERWAYTVGAYDGCCGPELVTVGLAVSTGHAALNNAVDAERAGVDLSQGRQRDIVGNVDVVFRPVEPRWVERLMNSARWFNRGWNFPVLQMVYPDLENRFQWEEGFDERFRQPLLQQDAKQTRVEQDFLAMTDPNSSLFDWKFEDDPHTSAYLSKTVHAGEEPVVYVSHDADGDWQFLGDSMAEGGGPVMVCLHHPIDADATLKELWDLPLGWVAERDTADAPWVRRQHPPEE